MKKVAKTQYIATNHDCPRRTRSGNGHLWKWHDSQKIHTSPSNYRAFYPSKCSVYPHLRIIWLPVDFLQLKIQKNMSCPWRDCWTPKLTSSHLRQNKFCQTSCECFTSTGMKKKFVFSCSKASTLWNFFVWPAIFAGKLWGVGHENVDMAALSKSPLISVKW